MIRIEDCTYFFFSNPYYGYDCAYKDIIRLNNVVWIPSLPISQNSFVRFLFKIHHSKTVNRIVNLPFKDLWFIIPIRKRYRRERRMGRKVVFIFNQLWSLTPVARYVRFHFRDSKTVLQISDYREGEKELVSFISEFKEMFDLIVTYDKKQAEHYSISFFPNVHSFVNLQQDEKKTMSDVYFCGRAEDRLRQIQGVVSFFLDKNLTCDVWVTNVEKADQSVSGIHYNEPLSYEQHLAHMANTKCVLYIQQGGAEAIEWRLILAVLNNKRIITNVQSIADYPFYDPAKIFILNGLDLNSDSLNRFIQNIDTPINYNVDQNSFSPRCLLIHITSCLFS